MTKVEKDSGWAWTILLCCFIAMFLETGTVKALGVMLPTLREQFVSNTWAIGLAISLFPGFGALSCPLAGVLCKYSSPRFTVMTFSIITTIGFIVASVAQSVQMLMFACVLSGFSLGAESVLLSQLAIHFDKYFDLCTAISQSGLAFGILCMPILTQVLLDSYGWRGTMLVCAGLISHIVLCGALLKPILNEMPRKSQKQHTCTTTESKAEVSENNRFFHNITKNFIYYLDLHLFVDSEFVSMLIYNFGSGYSFTGWLIYLVPHAIELGFQSYNASLLATIGGFGNLVACFFYPIIQRILDDKATLYITTLLSSTMLILDPLASKFDSYFVLAILTASYAFTRAMAIMSVYKILKNVIKDKNMDNAVLWINVTYSIGAILSGFLSGWTFDATGSYTASFIILSVVSLLTLAPQMYVDLSTAQYKTR